VSREEFFKVWSSLHGDVKITGIVKGWLIISFTLTKPLAQARISPNVLTAGGVLASIYLWLSAVHKYALILLAISILLDAIDGTLAMLSGKASKRGAVLDSVADRIAEFFWALTFYKLGAPIWIIACAWTCAFAQEYLRARVAGLGVTQITLVTICERPVRASLLAIALGLELIHSQGVKVIAITWLIMQALSFISLMRHSFKRLSSANRISD
jgi:CDP-diacylglycerol--glycerol-3-phosphate 3-phosphatidyltransferase